MNIDLLLEVADFIEANPSRYRQSTWLHAPEVDSDAVTVGDFLSLSRRAMKEGACQTSACVAGNALLLAGADATFSTVPRQLLKEGTEDEWETVEAVEFDQSARLTLDLHPRVAMWLFDTEREAKIMPTLLRRLAVIAHDGDLDSEGDYGDQIVTDLATLEEELQPMLATISDIEYRACQVQWSRKPADESLTPF